MRKKTAILLLIFLSSLVPFSPAKAETAIKRDLNDAVLFLYISDAILLPENELDLEENSTGMLAPVYSKPADEVDTSPLLAWIIHAKKTERNDLDANCRLIVARLKAKGQDCEINIVNQYCQNKRTELNDLISFYRKMRGDRRKAFTKIWHNIKRNSRNFWHRIGPLGRRFLRQMGDETLQMVATGGFSGSTFKTLLKHTFKSVVRQKFREIIYQGVGRMLQGQIAILQAAGVDICAEEEEEVTTTEDKKEPGDCSSDRAWLDEFWEKAVIPRLVEEIKNCQPKAAGTYRNCLQEQAYSGVCPEDAVEACHALYEAIPKNDSGGSVTVSPAIMHGAAESVSTSLTYPSEGGAVSGEFFYTLYDSVNLCTVTTTSSVVGSYDLATCTMSGTAQLEAVYDGYACPGVCGPSMGACPKTFQGNVPWEATLENGELYGGVGISAPDISGFGFRAGP